MNKGQLSTSQLCFVEGQLSFGAGQLSYVVGQLFIWKASKGQAKDIEAWFCRLVVLKLELKVGETGDIVVWLSSARGEKRQKRGFSVYFAVFWVVLEGLPALGRTYWNRWQEVRSRKLLEMRSRKDFADITDLFQEVISPFFATDGGHCPVCVT